MKSVPVSEASRRRPPEESFCLIAARLCLTSAFMRRLVGLLVVLQTPKWRSFSNLRGVDLTRNADDLVRRLLTR